MGATIEQLKQIAAGPVWDGNLISKYDRDRLVQAGYVEPGQRLEHSDRERHDCLRQSQDLEGVTGCGNFF